MDNIGAGRGFATSFVTVPTLTLFSTKHFRKNICNQTSPYPLLIGEGEPAEVGECIIKSPIPLSKDNDPICRRPAGNETKLLYHRSRKYYLPLLRQIPNLSVFASY